MHHSNYKQRELIKDTIENYKACIRITKSNKNIVSFVILQYLPFLSLNTLDLIQEFNIETINDLYPHSTGKFTKLLSVNRNFLKTRTDSNKYSKVKKQLLKDIQINYNSLMKDYNIVQKLYIKIFGQKDLSVFSYKGIPFLNNLQIVQFLNQVKNENGEVLRDDLMTFSSSVSNFLKFILSNILNEEQFGELDKDSIIQSHLDFDMNDYFLYEQSRSDLFTNNLEMDQNIFLFSLLCQVNSVRSIYPEIIDLQGNTIQRMKCIVYLILIKGIWLYNEDNNDSPSEFRRMVSESEKIFIGDEVRSEFRNGLFHYDIPQEAIYKENITTSLVEHYLKIEFSEFDNHMNYIFDMYIEIVNYLLFNENKLFLGSNVI